MKRSALIVFSILLLAGMLDAQSLYTRIGMGFSGGTSYTLDLLYKYTEDVNGRTLRVQPVDLGSGFSGTAAFGLMPIKYVGFEFAVSDFNGFVDRGDSIVRLFGGTNSEASIKVNVLSFIPSVVITAGLEKVNPYARFGLVIGVLPSMYHRYESYQPTTNPPKDIEAIEKYSAGVSLGFQASGGVTFRVSKVIGLFIEMNFTGMSYAPKKSELIKYTLNGEDQLPTMNTKQRETLYFSKLNLDEVIPDTSPDKKLLKSYSLNSVGACFGVVFRF